MGQGEPPFPIDIEDIIVKEIKERLKSIGRYCPDEIVKNAREKERKVKKSNNKDLPNVFIQIDNEIKIDIQDGHIKEFSETVLKFVEGIAHFFQKLSGLRFVINPAGSFPLGNKIEQIDEFDFVLEWVNLPKELTKLHLSEIREFYYRRRSVINYPGMIIWQLLLEFQDIESVSIKTLIQKRFAMNLVISWKCSYCHIHEVSLDLAISLKLKKPMQESMYPYPKMEIDFKNTSFERIFESNEFIYYCFPFRAASECWSAFEKGRVDTNYFDKYLFQRFDKISPNIKLIFRITKFICSKVFPRHCRNRICMLQRMNVYEFEPIISSYVLKQLLFKEVLTFPSSKDWSAALIHLRVTSLFKRLLKIAKIKDVLNPNEERYIREEQSKLKFELLDTCAWKLTSWFQNDFTERSKYLTASKAADGSRQLWFLRKVAVITAKEPNLTQIYTENTGGHFNFPIFKVDMPGTRSETSNTKKIFYDMYNEIISNTICIDLTTHNELYFPLFAGLYLGGCGVLEKEDFKSNRVIEKLIIIMEIAEKFEITPKTVCSTLIECKHLLSCNDDYVIKVSKIFSQVTMKKAASIYRYFEQQALRNEKTIYNVNENNVDSMLSGAAFKSSSPLSQRPNNKDFDGKEISLLETFFYNGEVTRFFPVHKERLWLYSAIMKSVGKI